MQSLQSVSTLMDGELNVDEGAREIARLKVNSADAPDRETWDAYHLIGDVMRDGAAGVPALSAGFSARFCERLAQEPTVLAPRAGRTNHPSRIRDIHRHSSRSGFGPSQSMRLSGSCASIGSASNGFWRPTRTPII